MEKRNNGWIHGKSRLPDAADGDADGKVFVWHAFQGVMLIQWDDYAKNSFYVCWMRISEGTGPWIPAVEGLPAKEDSDALNCVLAMDRHGDIRVMGYRQFEWNGDLVRWQRLPAPPSDYRELRKMQ